MRPTFYYLTGMGSCALNRVAVNAALFRAHVDKDPQTFFRVHAYYSDRFVQGLISWQDYRAYLAGARSVRELAAWDDLWTTLGTGAPVIVRVAYASCNFLQSAVWSDLNRQILPRKMSVLFQAPGP